MANWTYRIYLNEQCIVVAIGLDVDDIQEIAAFFSFGPKAVLGAAKEGNLTGFHGLLLGLFIHEAEHQHLLCIIILDDGWNQSAHLFEI